MKEVGELLTELSFAVKKEYRIVLRDYYFDELSHKEIARKHQIAVGSVGVYIQRGLSALRSAISKRPKLEKEFLEVLGDSGVVRVLLPLISAVQLGGWIIKHAGPFSRRRDSLFQDELSDEDRLERAHEKLPDQVQLSENKTAQLMAYVCRRHPGRYDAWVKHRQEV